MKQSKLTIAIIIGGHSVEREISLISGLQAYYNLDDTKYNKEIIYIDKNNYLYVGKDLSNIDTYKNETYKNLSRINLINKDNIVYYYKINKPKKLYKIDVFIPVVHGYNIEDGTIMGFLDMYNATYTSSSLISSACTQDKDITKLILSRHNIETLEWITLYKGSTIDYEKLVYPKIVKPAYLGSSIGINIATNNIELSKYIKEAFNYCNKVIIEDALTNFNEYNIAIYETNQQLITSQIEQVNHTKDILSFDDKYISDIDKLSRTNRIIPANISSDLVLKIEECAKKIYQIFNLQGVIRIDFIYDNDKNKLYVNEINNIPGSLAYYLFEKNDISFTKLLDDIIKNALINKEKNKKLISIYNSNILSKKSIKLNK